MNTLFLDKMKDLLKEDYPSYVETLSLPAYKGIRINLLKESKELLLNAFDLTPSLFCKEGYYVNKEISGNHPYHRMGLFYMQEPSASSAVTILDVNEGDWVLDLCAAPGGKSSQIASHLRNTGFLVSNEIVNNRAQILLSNMERMGVTNNMITNTSPDILCEEMKGCFDKVLVDAPCSGEGMFKKHDAAIEGWSKEHVESCATRQSIILKEAYKALKTEGILVYSTCTYSIEENEQVIYNFLQEFKDMELLDCGVEFGRIGYPYKDLDITKVRRILPMDKGEGHFIAKLKKHGDSETVSLKYVKDKKLDPVITKFFKDQLDSPLSYIMVDKDKVYMKDEPFIQLKKTKIIRQGVLCGEIIKNRFEPHHHFYMSARLLDKFMNKVELNEEEVQLYMQGEVLNKPCKKGFVALTYKGFVVGFGKSDTNQIKNKYPKGLRVR